MAEQPNLIRERIEVTKDEIGQDFASLESQLRSTVEGTIENVKEGLQKITPTHQIKQFPLWSLGGSLVAGAAVGGWLAGRSSSSSFERTAFAPSVPRGPRQPGPFDEELKLIKGVVLGSLARSFGKMLKQAIPAISGEVDEVIGRIATKAEGHLLHKAEMGDGGAAKEWAPTSTETPTPDGEPKSYH